MKFIRKNWAYILVLTISLIFALQVVLYYSTFKNFDFGWNIFTGLVDKNWDLKDSQGDIVDDGLEGKWGAFGDFVGGILNPILGFITIILLLIAHQKDKTRDDIYHKQRETDLFLVRIDKLKDIHLEHVKNLYLIKIENIDEEDVIKYIHQGSFFFTIF